MRFNELRETLQLRLAGEFKRFADEELRAVLTLLAGPGMIQRLDFGGFILLRPEVLSRYAAAVVRKVRKHPQDLFPTPQPSPALRAPSPTPVGEGLAASARTNCWPGIGITRISNACRARTRRWCCARCWRPSSAGRGACVTLRWHRDAESFRATSGASGRSSRVTRACW